MALFPETLIDEVVEMVRRRHSTLGAALGVEPAPGGEGPGEGEAPLHGQLRLVLRVANGEIARSRVSQEAEREVEQALAALMEALLGNPLGAPVPLTDAFWRTEIGILLSRVRWWLSADDLITISNAAALAFGANTQAARMRIARAIDSGILDSIPDPSVANPQHSRRVLRSQVERLRDQRQLPT